MFTWQFSNDRLSVPLRRTACFPTRRRVICLSLPCTRSAILSARPRNIGTGRRTLIWWSCWYFWDALNFFLVVHIHRDCIDFDLTSRTNSFGCCWRSQKIWSVNKHLPRCGPFDLNWMYLSDCCYLAQHSEYCQCCSHLSIMVRRLWRKSWSMSVDDLMRVTYV